MASRDPLFYRRRKGRAPTPPAFRSRFDPCGLLVNRYPTGDTVAKARLAEGGEDAPDRAILFSWPAAPTEED